MRFELISFPVCPYVQRSIITLRHKGVAFDLTHIDLASPPAWFDEVSPLGKVPILRVNGSDSLFESAAITEYLDEVTAPRLMPSDPIVRAKERAWIAHASTLTAILSRGMTAKAQGELDAAQQELFEGLEPVERFLDPSPYFRGRAFGLADAAYAPLFMRLELLHAWRPLPRWLELSKTRRWAQTLLELPEVRDSVGPGFTDELRAFLRKRGSLFAG